MGWSRSDRLVVLLFHPSYFPAFIRHLRLERKGDKGTEDEKKKKKKKGKKKKKKKKKGNKLSENDARLLYARRMK